MTPHDLALLSRTIAHAIHRLESSELPGGQPGTGSEQDLAALTDPLREALHPRRGWVHQVIRTCHRSCSGNRQLGYDQPPVTIDQAQGAHSWHSTLIS